MVNVVKIGCIGCGGNANGHMRRLHGMERADIVAVCDIREELSQRAAEAYEAEAYTDHKKMLERDDLDAVYISIPVHVHGEPELDVIERGLPFLVEKPVARDMQTALRVQEEVEAKGLLTAVGYQLRYTGAADIAKEMLAEEKVGMAVAKYWSGSGRGPEKWTRRMAQSGGQLLEQATHTIDMMRYLVGEFNEVYAKQTNRMLPQIDCPDVNSVTFDFDNGVLGSLTATWAYDPKDWSNANVVDILIDGGHLHWTHQNVILYKDGEAKEFARPGPSIDEMFVKAVAANNPSLVRSPYSDGVKSLAVSLAMNLSAAGGRIVSVAELYG